MSSFSTDSRIAATPRQALHLADAEARLLNHNYIGTEHILLGLIHEGEEDESIAAKVLASLGISLEAAREQVKVIVGPGEVPLDKQILFTPRTKKVLELSLRESFLLGSPTIETEHILLGLIREGEGVGAQILAKLGADLPRVRQAIINEIADKPLSAEITDEDAPTGEPLTHRSLGAVAADVMGAGYHLRAMARGTHQPGEEPPVVTETEIRHSVELLRRLADDLVSIPFREIKASLQANRPTETAKAQEPRTPDL